MTGRCWWRITGAVSPRNLEDQEQERDTRNRTVRIAVEVRGLGGMLLSSIMWKISMKASRIPAFKPLRLRSSLLFVLMYKICLRYMMGRHAKRLIRNSRADPWYAGPLQIFLTSTARWVVLFHIQSLASSIMAT